MTEGSDRRWMERAVQLMMASRSEHTSKLDPLVGAVLLLPSGEVLESGRANLRVGDHAEYDVIERHGHALDLEGATLYVTLEPCRSRTSPKRGCAERIVSARIARVLVGIIDPDPNVNGRGIAHLAAHRIEIGHFDEDLAGEIARVNAPYLDEAAARGVASGDSRSFSSSAEERKSTRASLDDLSPVAIERFLAACGAHRGEVAVELARRGYLDATGKDAPPAATIDGLVCLGTRPSDILPHCCVEALRLIGSAEEGVAPEKVAPNGQFMFSGPLYEVVDGIVQFFLRHVASVELVTGSIRRLVSEYPEAAVREAVVNALVHRDYAEGRHVSFHMFRDCIRVTSPGLAPPPITLEQLRLGTARSMRRNSLIAEHARILGQIDARGAGLVRMAEAMDRHALARPLFEYSGDYLVVTLLGRERSGGMNPELAKALSARQKEINSLLESRGRLTVSDCVEVLHVDRNTALRELKILVSFGIAEPRGSGRGTHYVLRLRV